MLLPRATVKCSSSSSFNKRMAQRLLSVFLFPGEPESDVPGTSSQSKTDGPDNSSAKGPLQSFKTVFSTCQSKNKLLYIEQDEVQKTMFHEQNIFCGILR